MSKHFTYKQLSTEPFVINKRVIDAEKGIIWRDSQAEAIEPKVMQVLLVLASEQNNLVTQEALFNEVWPNSIFSPGSIRRCITILRKLLDDDDASTSLIVTHPKRGYSLNAQISLASKRRLLPRQVLLVSVLTIIVSAGLYLFNRPSISPVMTLTSATPITASEQQEYNSKVSSDGTNLAFLQVDANSGEKALLIKQLMTEQETIMAQGEIRAYAWSPSADFIAYTRMENQQETINIIKLNQATEKHFKTPVFQHQQRISSLHWDKNDTLYCLTRTLNGVQLTGVNLISGTISAIKTFTQDFTPYELNLAVNSEQLALIGFDNTGHSVIKTLNLNTDDLNPENLADVVTLNENRYFISWHPSEQLLLLSDGRALMTVTLTGQLNKLNYENYDFAQFPQFTPDGNAIMLTQGKLDIDILLAGENNISTPIINSNTVDRAAVLSPDQRKLAFISQRKGFPQIYLFDMATQQSELIYENTQQLLGLSQPIWHPSGKQLSFASYEFPIIITFNQHSFTTEHFDQPLGVPVDWFTHSNALLTLSRQNNSINKLKLTTKTTEKLASYNGSMPLLDNQDNLLYLSGTKVSRITNKVSAPVIELSQPISALTKQQNQLHMLVKQQEATLGVTYDLTSFQELAQYPLPKATNRISAISEHGIIYEVAHQQKDIVRLNLQ